MTAAAHSLNLAQPALSTQIRNLEEDLGVELIIRHSRGVTPTEAGKLLHQHAERILASVEQATHEVRALKTPRQTQLRLGTCPSMVLVLGPDMLIGMREKAPEFSLGLMEERSVDLLDALEQGQVDLALLYNVDERPDLKREAVIEEDLLLVTSPSQQPAGETVSFAEVLRHDLALGGVRSVLRQLVETQASRLSLELRLTYEIHSVASMKSLVARGAAATIMPFSLAAKELRNGTLAGRRIDRPFLTRTMYVVTQRAPAPFLDDPRVVGHIRTLLDTYVAETQPWTRRLT